MAFPLEASVVYDLLAQQFVLGTIWKVLLIILILTNIKLLPGVWHIRMLNTMRFVLRSYRSKHGPSPAQLFQPVIISSHAPLAEIDYNIHKSNSTYFADLDIARSHLVCTLFSSAIEQARGSKSDELFGGGNNTFGLALGAVSCTFKREVKPYEKYEMWTRILSWDNKWIYVVTHFVRKDRVRPRFFTLYRDQNFTNGRPSKAHLKDDAIIASALSKCVFKKGRLTITPEVMLQASGLLPPRPGEPAVTRRPTTKAPKKALAAELLNGPFRCFEMADVWWDATKKNLMPEAELSGDESTDWQDKQKTEAWTWERVESERRRGLELANHLSSLGNLEREFTGEAEALGCHNDLFWLLGLTY